MLENDYKPYLELAQKILKGKNTEAVVASLLRHVYDDEFIASSYSKIKNVKVEMNDNTRLFIALGEKDGLNVNKLLKLIHEKTKVPGRKIKDVKVMANFSFVSAPLEEAELIMKTLNKGKRKNDKPMVEVANSDKSSGEGKKKRSRGSRSKNRK